MSSRRSQEGCRPAARTTSVTQSIQPPSRGFSKYLAFHPNQKVKLVTVVLNSWRAPWGPKKVVNLPPARLPLRKVIQQTSSESQTHLAMCPNPKGELFTTSSATCLRVGTRLPNPHTKAKNKIQQDASKNVQPTVKIDTF